MTVIVLVVSLFVGLLGFGIYLRAKRWWVVGAYALSIVLLYGLGFEPLGTGKPMQYEWRNTAEFEILAYMIVEDDTIYLWLSSKENSTPRYYTIPYTDEDAKKLHQANESLNPGETLMMRGHVGLDDQEPLFYARPQEADPPKT